MFDDELSKLGACPSKADLRNAWTRVIQRVLECGQDKEALRNLMRQGGGRISGLARVMTKIGIIECVKKARPGPSTAAGDIFTLGLDTRNSKYRFCTEDSKFDDFYDALEPANALWQKLLQKIDGEPFDLSSFCKEVRSELQIAGDAHPAFGMKAEGYCFDFAYRKVVIAEASRRKDEVNWETSMGEIRKISADSGDLLDEVDTHAVSVALSHAVFGRTDWAIMLSCFACLWSEVVAKRVITKEWSLEELLELLRSGRLSSIVAEYKQAHGYAPHPFTLLEIYEKNHRGVLDSHPTPRMKLKREADSRQAPTGTQLSKFNNKSKKMRSMERSV